MFLSEVKHLNASFKMNRQLIDRIIDNWIYFFFSFLVLNVATVAPLLLSSSQFPAWLEHMPIDLRALLQHFHTRQQQIIIPAHFNAISKLAFFSFTDRRLWFELWDFWLHSNFHCDSKHSYNKINSTAALHFCKHISVLFNRFSISYIWFVYQ